MITLLLLSRKEIAMQGLGLLKIDIANNYTLHSYIHFQLKGHDNFRGLKLNM